MPILPIANYAAIVGVSTSDTLLSMVATSAEGAVKRFLRYDPGQAVRTEYYPVNFKEPTGLSEDDGEYTSQAGRAVWSPSASASRAGLILPLSSIPVRSVTSIFEHYGANFGESPGAFPAESELESGTDYVADWKASGICANGFLRRLSGCWSSEPGSIKVIYTAGYSESEMTSPSVGGVDASAIAQACYLTVLKAYKTIASNQRGASGWQGGPLFMERLGDYSYMTEATATRVMSGMLVSIPPEAQELLQGFIHFGMSAG